MNISERFKFISAVHLFLVKNDQVLLLRRFNTGYEDGHYSVPAGHLDGNETVIQAMIREAYEEACIKIKPEDLEVIHVMHRKADYERIDFFLTTTKWQGSVENGEPNKCDDLSWFPLGALPNNTVPYIRFAIENYQKKIFYSELGWLQ